jgi:hypothetical protein
MNHSKYSPSRLERILRCPGSVALCETVPKLPTSSFAAEGTLLHSYTQQVLETWPEPVTIEYAQEEHLYLVKDVVNYVQAEIDFMHPGTNRYQEQSVVLKDFPNVYGTLDFGVETPTEIHVIDFKFGQGVFVDAYNNSQLLAYLVGFIDLLYPQAGYKAAEEKSWFVHIAQPRLSNYAKVQVFPQDLTTFFARLDQSLRMAESDNPPIVPGEVQCRWCDAGGICRARLDQLALIQQSALLAFADMQENRATSEQIIALLEQQDEVKQAFKAMEKYVFLELAKGQPVPGFKLVRGRSNRAWHPATTVESLIEEFPCLEDVADSLLTVPALRGPAQIEKLLPRKERTKLEKFIVKPEGALTLAKSSSPKAAVNVTDPQEAFKDFTDNPE